MKFKKIIKVFVDVIMTALFLVLMAHHITGNRVHEWLGITLFILFILHNFMNYKWYKAILKGKYSMLRFLQTAINLLLFITMLSMMVSGIMLSREVFVFLNISAGMFGRRLHMVSTAWGFLLMSIHLGFHWGIVVGLVKKMAQKSKKKIFYTKLMLRLVAVIISVYGIYAFVTRKIWNELFLLVEYAFFDNKESALLFFADYIGIMGLFACVAYFIMKKIKKEKRIEEF